MENRKSCVGKKKKKNIKTPADLSYTCKVMSAPSSIGLVMIGVANVASHTWGIPAAFATVLTACKHTKHAHTRT